MASTRSRSSCHRDSNCVPWSSISSAFQPPPIPNRNRPFEMRSSDATSLAVWIGSRWITRQMPVATLSFFVTVAAEARQTKGSITS
jgi:hypothetical protein